MFFHSIPHSLTALCYWCILYTISKHNWYELISKVYLCSKCDVHIQWLYKSQPLNIFILILELTTIFCARWWIRYRRTAFESIHRIIFFLFCTVIICSEMTWRYFSPTFKSSSLQMSINETPINFFFRLFLNHILEAFFCLPIFFLLHFFTSLIIFEIILNMSKNRHFFFFANKTSANARVCISLCVCMWKILSIIFHPKCDMLSTCYNIHTDSLIAFHFYDRVYRIIDMPRSHNELRNHSNSSSINICSLTIFQIKWLKRKKKTNALFIIFASCLQRKSRPQAHIIYGNECHIMIPMTSYLRFPKNQLHDLTTNFQI